MAFIVDDVTSPVEIARVHGGRSSIRWKRSATENMLHNNPDSFESAQIPPDGVIGAHVHSRTEEIYFIIRGRGR